MLVNILAVCFGIAVQFPILDLNTDVIFNNCGNLFRRNDYWSPYRV